MLRHSAVCCKETEQFDIHSFIFKSFTGIWFERLSFGTLPKVPDGLFPSGDLVMSINNPNSGLSEKGGATISGMVGNEESLTTHEFRERDSSSWPGMMCNCGQLSRNQGKKVFGTCACWIFLVLGEWSPLSVCCKRKEDD